MVADSSYTLSDPRPIAASSPYTFFLPAAGEIEAVAKGDLVKLTFEYPHATDTWSAERMWVNVKEAAGNSLVGVLENRPNEPTALLKKGARISFERHHIIDIIWKHPERAPQPEDHREYWERCLVDSCVLDGSRPVEYLYREVPDLAQEGDTFPDSGWRIRGRMGDATDEEMEAREVSYVALAAVLNNDDSWLALIDAPIGAAFMRNFETDTYAAVK